MTSVFWPLTFVLLFGERSVAIVRQSRLLWLNIPGSRDAVRTGVEKVLWRNLGFGAAFLVVVAAIAVSPLVGADTAGTLLGLAMTTGAAAIYGTYVAMAAVPSIATHFWGFGSIAVLQLVLLIRLGAVARGTCRRRRLSRLAGGALLRAARDPALAHGRLAATAPSPQHFVGVPRSL